VTVGEVVAYLKLDLTDFRQGLRRANDLLEENRAKAMQIGTALVGFAAAAAGVGAVAVKLASEMEAALTDMNKVLKLSDTELERVAEHLHELARATGIEDEALSKALANIGKAGKTGAEGMQVLEAATKAAVAGGADVTAVGDTLVTVLRGYNLAGSEAGKVTDALYQASLKGRMTFTEITGAIKGLVPVASQLGIGYDQLAAALSTMTTVGYDAENSLMGLNMVMIRMTNPSAQLKAALQSAGYESGQALIQAKGFAGAIAFLTAAAGDDEQAMIQMAGGARAFKAVAALAADEGRLFAQKLTEISAATGSVDAAFAKTEQTFRMQWARMIVTAKQAGETLGNIILPMMNALGGVLRMMITLGRATAEAVPAPLRATAAAAALLGTALFGVAGALMLYQTRLQGTVALTLAWAKAMAITLGLMKGEMAAGTLVTLAGQIVRPGDYSALVNLGRGVEVVTGSMGRLVLAMRAAILTIRGWFAAIGPIGWIAIGIGVAAEAWLIYKNHVEAAAKAQREQTESARREAEALKGLLDQLTAINAKIAEAKGKPGGTVAPSLLAEQQKIADELSKQFPLLIKGYTDTGHAILAAADAQGQFDQKSRQALEVSKAAARQQVYAAGQASNAAQQRVREIQGYIDSLGEAIKQYEAGQTRGVAPYQVETWRARIDELRKQQSVAAEAARAAQQTEVAAAEAERKLLEWERHQGEVRQVLRKAAGATAIAEIERETAAMRKAGIDQVTLEQYKQQRIWLEDKKWKDERVKLQVELLKAQGKTDEAALLEAAQAAKTEFAAAQEDVNRRAQAELKLQRALTDISRKGAESRSETIRATAESWQRQTEELYRAGILSAGQYVEQLTRIAEATGKIAEQQKKAGDPHWLDLVARQTEVQKTAAEELATLRDKLQQDEQKAHDERLQWTKEERDAQLGLYQHRLRLLDLSRAYALDQLKITGQESEYAQGLVNKDYLAQIEAAKPEAAAGIMPSADQMSAWAEKYREATIAAWQGHAISETEAQTALAAARDAALQAEQSALDADRAAFAERRTWHDQTMKMLGDEQTKLGSYVDVASKALTKVFDLMKTRSEDLQRTIAQAVGGRTAALATVSGWGRITTESGGARVTNFYYEGRRQTPSPKIRELMDQIADELDREKAHPRD